MTERARAGLRAYGAYPAVIRKILGHVSAEGAVWALRYLEWAQQIPRWNAGILCAGILRALDGSEADRQEPAELAEIRAAAARPETPLPVRASYALPSPAPPELRPRWERFLEAARRDGGSSHRLLLYQTRSVESTPAGWVVTVRGEKARTWLERDRAHLLRLARRGDPDFPDLLFVPEKGERS